MIYPAMHWCLQRLPQLKKRAYLARYLMPVEVPMEFMQDQALVDLHESYRQLQVSEACPRNALHLPRAHAFTDTPPREYIPSEIPTPTLPAHETTQATCL